MASVIELDRMTVWGLTRPQLIRLLAAAVLTTFLLSTSTVAANGAEAQWGYTGHEGPENWGTLTDEYRMCASGMNQSPININMAAAADLFELDFNYNGVDLQIANKGHTVQVDYSTTIITEGTTIELNDRQYSLPSATSHNSSISISGEKYKLLQVHFHSPSEHYLIGPPYAMEAHFVHSNNAGQLAVVGVFLSEGKDNKFLRTLWENMPKHVDGIHAYADISINAEDLLPEDRAYYHYRGSLTTPPCSEGVRWFVMRNSVEVSASQISQFLSAVSKNARPVQPINNRFLLKSQ